MWIVADKVGKWHRRLMYRYLPTEAMWHVLFTIQDHLPHIYFCLCIHWLLIWTRIMDIMRMHIFISVPQYFILQATKALLWNRMTNVFHWNVSDDILLFGMAALLSGAGRPTKSITDSALWQRFKHNNNTADDGEISSDVCWSSIAILITYVSYKGDTLGRYSFCIDHHEVPTTNATHNNQKCLAVYCGYNINHITYL